MIFQSSTTFAVDSDPALAMAVIEAVAVARGARTFRPTALVIAAIRFAAGRDERLSADRDYRAAVATRVEVALRRLFYAPGE